MPVLAYFSVMTPFLLFALVVASALLDPNNGAKLGSDEARASSDVSAQREQKPEMFDRLKALRIDKP